MPRIKSLELRILGICGRGQDGIRECPFH
jgi:hypothetical protein